MRLSTDVVVSGGGVAGLAAAAAFAEAGFSVLCVDPTPAVTSREATGADLRSTAFLQPSRAVLEAAGLWPRLAPFAAPLQIMRIVDAGGPDLAPRLTRDFDAREISDQPFGWNLPNWLLRREMAAALEAHPDIDFRPKVTTTGLVTREAEARISLSDGSKISARLVIAADGRESFLRQAIGIPVKTTRYGQKALVFAVSHPLAHGSISTEIHRSGGPFTLVPLPDHQGQPMSAVVWMEVGREIERLAALDVTDFEAKMTARSCGLLGHLTLATPRAIWPIITQIAARMAGERVALIAEAAHVVPPIGAQGLNMSMADLGCLVGLARANPVALGSRAMLDAYHAARHPDVVARAQGIDALNRASMLQAPALRDLRASALNALYAAAPVRKALMRAGLRLGPRA
jgi:2-octaprenyl-6-methoxyphenol hydroxylase